MKINTKKSCESCQNPVILSKKSVVLNPQITQITQENQHEKILSSCKIL